MGKGTIKTKAMTMAVAMSMVAGLCPSTVFAASGSEVAADGTYTKTAHVTRIESEDSDDEWNEYDVEVSLTVKDGKFEDITVTPGEGYDSGNSSYFNKAYDKQKGIKTLLKGQAATEDVVNSWKTKKTETDTDAVSGATRTAMAVKAAALEAIADIYVPVKSETTKVEVADADITAGKTTINVQLPDEFEPEYSVDGLDVSVEGNVLSFKAVTESRAAASVKPGKYTLTIKDKKNKYADVVTTFTLTTKDMPAAYDAENKKLVEAEGFDTDALKAYLGNITSVNVNGKDYAASGRGSVVIINKDGTIKTDADPFKDAVAGTEFQITVASTGYTTPLTFTYKIAETPAPAEVDTTALEAAIAEADNLKEADYTAESWSVYQAALQSARTALEAKESQDAVDQALAALNAAKDALVKAEEEPVTINTASLEKAIADAKALKEADYTADSWKALQSALSDAQKALEAKESQEAVDNATNSLNKAIKALVKKNSSSVKKTDGTTNKSKTSGSDSVKTGDPASVFGWLGLAVSSLGAGMGGFAWKRRKRK